MDDPLVKKNGENIEGGHYSRENTNYGNMVLVLLILFHLSDILQDIVEDLESHLMTVHELDEPTALAVTHDRPVQVVLESPTHVIYSSPG